MIKELEKDTANTDNLSEVFKTLEREGRFDENINPIDWDGALPVDEDFPYVPRGKLFFKYLLTNLFIIKPFRWYQARVVYRLKVLGKENLKGIKSAIVTSNHVAIFDCLVNAFALRPRRVRTIAAEFNNRRGRFGGWMRAGGMLPLSSNRKTLRHFNESLEYYIKKGTLIMFYPEQSMWPLYDKPRPFKSGAFHYAIKLNVPIVPMFITYRQPKNEKKLKEGHKYFTLNILEPIYPNDNGEPISEQAKRLADTAYEACVAVYEKTYGKKLEYEK